MSYAKDEWDYAIERLKPDGMTMVYIAPDRRNGIIDYVKIGRSVRVPINKRLSELSLGNAFIGNPLILIPGSKRLESALILKFHSDGVKDPHTNEVREYFKYTLRMERWIDYTKKRLGIT